MSVEDKNVIDFVSIDRDNNVVLTISDHLEWSIDNEHLLILQDKINCYLGAIEGGEFYINYPNAKDKQIVISVIALHNPSEQGQIFLERAKGLLNEAGYNFEFKLHSAVNGD